MGDQLTASPSSSRHRPWEPTQAKSFNGESGTSLAEILDTAFTSTVDQAPNEECNRNGKFYFFIFSYKSLNRLVI